MSLKLLKIESSKQNKTKKEFFGSVDEKSKSRMSFRNGFNRSSQCPHAVAFSSEILSALPSILCWLSPQTDFSHGSKLAASSPWDCVLFVPI